MTYCRLCILPDTRPGIVIGADGVCNACKNSNERGDIDWAGRRDAFAQIVKRAKERNLGYDCLVPGSGGKDSIWQVSKCLEYGLKPLVVTWKTPARSSLGWANLQSMINMGVDHIDYQINPEVERYFMLKALKKHGSTAIPMHMAIHAIPVNLCVKLDIPLLVQGENPAFEYGSTEEDLTRGFRLDRKWIQHFGVTNGTSAEDWLDETLTRKAMTPYFFVEDGVLERRQIDAVFLGYYFPWDVETSLNVATKRGFKRRHAPKVGLWDYTDIDCDFIAVHHYLKWYKFGVTRLFDNLSLEIRRRRMTREQALNILREKGEQRPVEDIATISEFMGITVTEFDSIAENFRNHDIWKRVGGVYQIPDFILSDWNWEEHRAV